MRFRSFFLLSVFVLLGSVVAGAQTIGGSISNGTVGRGKTVRATVTMSIPGGLHVNWSGDFLIASPAKAIGNSGIGQLC